MVSSIAIETDGFICTQLNTCNSIQQYSFLSRIVKCFQVLLSRTDGFISTQLKDFIYCDLTLIFLFASS